MAILTVGTGISALSKIIGGGVTMEQYHQQWLADWKQEMTAGQWLYFASWITARRQAGDWSSQCPNIPLKVRDGSGRLVTPNEWYYIQTMANSILKKRVGRDGSPVPQCRSDWESWNPVLDAAKDQADPAYPGKRILQSSFGGGSTLLIVGLLVAGLFFVKGR